MKTKIFSLVLLFLVSGFVYAQNVPELMYYKFENNTATTTPNYASSPVGTNPTPVLGHTFTSGGQFDSCMSGTGGSGSTSYLNTGYSWALGTGNWTISFWVNNLLDLNPTYLFGDPGTSSFRCFYGGAALPNNILFRGGFTDILIACPMPGSHVFHIVRDGGNIIVYRNGVVLSTNARTINMPNGSGFKIGGYSSTNYSMSGKMDEWRLYNRALTPAEITATWNQELPLVTAGWTRQPSGMTTSLNTVSTVNQNVGWIGGNGGVVLRTINGGVNWSNVTGSPIGTADVYAICGLDANTCLVSTSPSATFVYRTSNGGVNWTQVFTQTGGFIDDIKFQNASTGYMYGDPVGARWSLWKSTNGGVNWDSTGLYLPQAGTEAGWNNAMWLSGNNLWFGTNNTRVYKSTNFGSTWSFGATTGSANSYSVAFNSNIGFTGQSALLKSTNSGDNYAAVTLPGTGTAYSFNGVLDRFWYCRTTNIYWSSDNGANFAVQFADTGTYQAMNLKLDGNIIRGWAVTSNGRIAMYNEVISGIANNQNNTPENYSLMQNYPNPFNPSTKISFSLPKAGDVKLIVFDILGREVATLINDYRIAGTHSVEFNASNLASGVYLYRIEAGDFKDVKRMVLIK